MFTSPITVSLAPESSPYRGRWLILNNGERLSDAATKEQAETVAKQARAQRNFRNAYDRAEDRRKPFSC